MSFRKWLSINHSRPNSQLTTCFLFFFFQIKNWKTSAVSTTVCWMVETQLWKLRGTSDTLNSYKICFLWTKRTIWLLVLSFTQNIVRACSMFYPYEGYRLPVGRWLPWMLPASAGRFPITILCTDTINKKMAPRLRMYQSTAIHMVVVA